jgi:hypothetical protein
MAMLETERRALLEARARLRARLSADPDSELREQLDEIERALRVLDCDVEDC